MAKITKLNPLAATVGAAVVASALSAPVQAEENPFLTTDLAGGYQVAEHHGEGSCGEGRCGEDKDGEGSCGEGNCGEDKDGEGSCGEGRCGGDA